MMKHRGEGGINDEDYAPASCSGSNIAVQSSLYVLEEHIE